MTCKCNYYPTSDNAYPPFSTPALRLPFHRTLSWRFLPLKIFDNLDRNAWPPREKIYFASFLRVHMSDNPSFFLAAQSQ